MENCHCVCGTCQQKYSNNVLLEKITWRFVIDTSNLFGSYSSNHSIMAKENSSKSFWGRFKYALMPIPNSNLTRKFDNNSPLYISKCFDLLANKFWRFTDSNIKLETRLEINMNNLYILLLIHFMLYGIAQFDIRAIVGIGQG